MKQEDIFSMRIHIRTLRKLLKQYFFLFVHENRINLLKNAQQLPKEGNDELSMIEFYSMGNSVESPLGDVENQHEIKQ